MCEHFGLAFLVIFLCINCYILCTQCCGYKLLHVNDFLTFSAASFCIASCKSLSCLARSSRQLECSALTRKKLRHGRWFITSHVITHSIFLFHLVILLFENPRLQNTSLALCYLPLINKGTDEVSCPLHYSFCHQFIHVSICMYL